MSRSASRRQSRGVRKRAAGPCTWETRSSGLGQNCRVEGRHVGLGAFVFFHGEREEQSWLKVETGSDEQHPILKRSGATDVSTVRSSMGVDRSRQGKRTPPTHQAVRRSGLGIVKCQGPTRRRRKSEAVELTRHECLILRRWEAEVGLLHLDREVAWHRKMTRDCAT